MKLLYHHCCSAGEQTSRAAQSERDDQEKACLSLSHDASVLNQGPKRLHENTTLGLRQQVFVPARIVTHGTVGQKPLSCRYRRARTFDMAESARLKRQFVVCCRVLSLWTTCAWLDVVIFGSVVVIGQFRAITLRYSQSGLIVTERASLDS